MKSSETIGKLAAALSKAQADLKNPALDMKNGHFGSRYASLLSTRDAIQPVFAIHGLSIIQFPSSQDGVGLETIILHESGEYISQHLTMDWTTDNPQKIMSLITYLRRYAMQGVANVVGDPDDDGNKAAEKEDPKITPTGGAYESLKEEDKAFVDTLATDVGAMMSKGDVGGAVEAIKESGIKGEDPSLETAFWSLIPSNYRSAMKKHVKGK